MGLGDFKVYRPSYFNWNSKILIDWIWSLTFAILLNMDIGLVNWGLFPSKLHTAWWLVNRRIKCKVMEGMYIMVLWLCPRAIYITWTSWYCIVCELMWQVEITGLSLLLIIFSRSCHVFTTLYFDRLRLTRAPWTEANELIHWFSNSWWIGILVLFDTAQQQHAHLVESMSQAWLSAEDGSWVLSMKYRSDVSI